jgi:hypothetical protein
MAVPTPVLGDAEFFIAAVHDLREAWGVRTFWDDFTAAIDQLDALEAIYEKTADPTGISKLLWESTHYEFGARMRMTMQMNLDKMISEH